MPKIETRLSHIELTVADLTRSRSFYEALGFVTSNEPTTVSDSELVLLGLQGSQGRRLSLGLGDQSISIVQFDPPGRPYPPDSTSTDLWFQHIAIVVSNMVDAYQIALKTGAAPITVGGPQTLPENAGGVTAWKFRDLDGHPLELLYFPPGKGAAVWHEGDSVSPFLGVSHTAISVGDVTVTQRFFEQLGLDSSTGSHNSGPEQEHLDDVPEDRCHVLPMMPKTKPPHVELLGYKVGTRRPMPQGTQANDIWATRMWIGINRPSQLDIDHPVPLPSGVRSALLHDPDGHLVVVAESIGNDEESTSSRPA